MLPDGPDHSFSPLSLHRPPRISHSSLSILRVLLHPRVASDPLAASKVRLQTELTKSKVARGLANRPDQHELQEAHITENAGVAPRLQAMAKQLDRSMKKDYLNQRLYNRNVETLKHQGVLPAADIAPALRSASLALAHSMSKDQVSHLLQTRPDHDQLVRAGILQGGGASGRIQAMQRRLSQQMTADRISQLLGRRADYATLQQQGVIQGSLVAPRLQGVQQQLGRNITRSQLTHLLSRRPSIEELEEKHIYIPVAIPGDEPGQWQRVDYDPETGRPVGEHGGGSEGDGYGEDGAEGGAGGEGVDVDEDEAGAQYEAARREEARQYAAAVAQSQQQQQQQQQQQRVTAEAVSASAAAAAAAAAAATSVSDLSRASYQRRSKNFHLTRLLLKIVAQMSEAGEISLPMKGVLKDLIVDQDPTILALAEHFDTESDIVDFKRSLISLGQRR